jgi:tripartite-type tricarboxylate transporter receptor subunit TctC
LPGDYRKKHKSGEEMLAYRKLPAAVSVAAALLGLHLPALAQSPEEFYRGKQVRLIIGNPAGGDYDLGGRLLAKYLGAHIPGNPTVIVQNMPGASTIAATNHLYNKAPRDGTVFGSFSRNIPNQAVLGQKNLEADPRRFTWIGASALPSRVCVARAASPIKTIADLFDKELIVAGSGAGSSLSIVPTTLNKVLGTKFKVVEGYAGANAAILALERGEVDGICHTYSLFRTSHASLIKEGKVRVLLHAEEAAFPDDPSVPSAYTYAKTDRQKQLLRFLFSSVEFGRPYVAPPEIPADRAEALRKAFAAALKDPGLVAEAERAKMDMTYRSPDELVALVQALYATPRELVAEAEEMMPEGGMN